MDTQLNRRNFLKHSSKAVLLGLATVHVVGCDDEKYKVTEDEEGNLVVRDLVDTNQTVAADAPEDEMTMACTPGYCAQRPDGGHTHGCNLLDETTIFLQCFGGHTHALGLSSGDLADLCATGAIVRTSSVDFGHTHDVEITV